MPDMMTFPDTVEEFMDQYKIVDAEGIYMSKGSEMVSIFRMKQWFEHVSAQPDALEVAKILLKAAHQLLMKQNDSGYVLNLLAETVYYDDGLECDGSCLMDDIEYWFDVFLDEDLKDE